MKITQQTIPGLKLIEPMTHGDDRGWFCETYQRRRYADAGITDDFVQDNMSFSQKGVLRGLHYVRGASQAQLFHVSAGEVYAVVADLRPASPTFGRWWGTRLEAASCRQVYMAPGLASGFCVTGDHAFMHYKVSREYDPEMERGVAWNDPDLGIGWPADDPIISERDAGFPLLKDIPASELPDVSGETA